MESFPGDSTPLTSASSFNPSSPTSLKRSSLTPLSSVDHETRISLASPPINLPTNPPALPSHDVAGSHQPVRLPQVALSGPAPALKGESDANSIAPISSYISYRQSFTHHPAKKPRFGTSNGFDAPSQPEESRRLISETGGFEEDGDMVIEMDLLPPRWVDVQDEVSELLADIAQKSAELDKLHQKHLLPGFGDEDLRRQDEGVIEGLTQDVTRSFHKCQNSIKRIDLMVRESKQQGGVTSGEETMAKNIQISLASRVQESSARFRKKQSTYLKSKSCAFGPSVVGEQAHMPLRGWAHRAPS